MLKPRRASAPEPARGLHISDVEWVAAFYPELQRRPDWLLEIRFVDDCSDSRSRSIEAYYLREPSEIAMLMRTHRSLVVPRAKRFLKGGECAPPYGLFWGLQPRARRRPGREHVAAFVALAVSMDPGEWLEWPEERRLSVMWEELHAIPRSPSIALWNGRGLDAFWLLREPLFDRGRGEQVQRTMARALRANLSDAGTLFRWPNTVNYRASLQGRLSRVVHWMPEARFDFSSLAEAFLPYLEQPEQKVGSEVPAELWGLFQRLLHEDDALRALWRKERLDLSLPEQYVLNLDLAARLRSHIGPSDFLTLAPLAPWNRRCPSSTVLSKLWQEAHGGAPPPDTDAPGAADAQIADVASPLQTMAPAADPRAATVPASSDLPGMLLSQLPESAWTEWARLYRAAVGASTEAADEFHYVALLAILGTMLGRSVRLQYGRPLYMNVYAVLVGPTGDRKSTAAHIALDLLARITPNVQLINGAGSQEGLMERMTGQQRTLWYVDEMASLLKKARRESSGTLIELITELFHCPDSLGHSTRSKAIHLQRPTLNILAGSTLAWLEGALLQEDVLGGFVNRFIFVTGHAKPDDPMPSRPDENALSEVADRVRRALQTTDRELGWGTGARDLWSGFYQEWRRSIAGMTEHMAALLRRIDLYILKFAAIAATMDQASAISTQHLNAAIDLGRYLAGCACTILGNLGASNDVRLESLIEQKLKETQGAMRRKQLRQSLGGRISGEKLDRVLTAMERNGLIEQITEATTHGPSRLVRLT